MSRAAPTGAQTSSTPERATPERSVTAPAPVTPAASTAARALALQRAVGNRAATRIIARWAKHPDEKEKGKLLSDEAAADYLHFNVPLNK